MTPTEVRDSIADVHQVDQLLTDVAGHRRLDALLDLGEQVGLARARTKPPIANPTISNGNIAKTVKYVMPAA